MDNVFIERLWRSLKHKDIYLKGYADGREAKRGIAAWIAFYNSRRPHQASATAPHGSMVRRNHRRDRRRGCGHDGQRKSVAHIPTAATTPAADRTRRSMIPDDRSGPISS